MSSLKDIKLFTTQSHACSYLPGEEARTLFIDPEYEVSTEFHTHLSEIGFRRSGAHMYRPHCSNCQHCVASRVIVERFTLNKRFRRILRRNEDLKVEVVDSIATDEYYVMYEKYINERHSDGDMYPASREQFESFLVQACESTLFYRISSGERLVAVMITDLLSNGLSAVYTFYNINEQKRSLGNYAILWQIEEARRRNLPYVYLGYWIRDCDKMNYKLEYRPIELLLNQRWTKLT
ncbi:MAG: arginyltransferase [Gammaproteobacteria bacterium]|jgi:arginine-tRNA-protein transferase|nr:arginyltransferase [Verrucomicrobiota bacterium]MBT5483664.1 arginyltransferase [Gammaproteobacteria bacterium]MBT6042175.1 arginyltransferase [Gammaproteobacteria bacterium]